MNRIHFIGIGGVGMNGLAQLATLSGHAVSGSDRGYVPDSHPFDALERMGIRIVKQDGSGIHPDTDRVVYSTAIEQGNPDLERAASLGIPLLHRAEFLRELIGTDRVIAVTGTAGKTTTTGLLGWIFECLGEDPTVYNGAAVLNWKSKDRLGNVRKGKNGLWIIEADESDRSLLQFHPDHAVITNVSKDHFELEELHALFDQFESQTAGITIRGPCRETVLNNRTGVSAVNPCPALIGRHNRENIACAAALCIRLGFEPDRIYEAVAAFKGIERRLEIAGEADDITVIDDYAHNPAKIAAAISALTDRYQNLHIYWRPHGFAPLHQHQEEMLEVFRGTDAASVFILPVYFAGGSVERKTTAADFVKQLNSAGIRALAVEGYDELKRKLEERARPGDAILGMGARDPELPRFARRLVDEWKIS